MSKVTTKLQVTLPKAIADQYGIRPGDEVEWLPAGDSIRVVPPGRTKPARTRKERLELFDRATKRQRAREKTSPARASESGADKLNAGESKTSQRKTTESKTAPSKARGWSREDLYQRG